MPSVCNTGAYLGRIYLYHTHIAVAFVRWNFLLFSSYKTIEIPKSKGDGYKSLLQKKYALNLALGRQTVVELMLSLGLGRNRVILKANRYPSHFRNVIQTNEPYLNISSFSYILFKYLRWH